MPGRTRQTKCPTERHKYINTNRKKENHDMTNYEEQAIRFKVRRCIHIAILASAGLIIITLLLFTGLMGTGIAILAMAFILPQITSYNGETDCLYRALTMLSLSIVGIALTGISSGLGTLPLILLLLLVPLLAFLSSMFVPPIRQIDALWKEMLTWPEAIEDYMIMMKDNESKGKE